MPITPQPNAPSRAIVDRAAYAHNLGAVRRMAGPDARIAAVVKADAYGHGAVPMARAALEGGAGMLAVAHASEGVALREAGIAAPILVMVQPLPDAYPALVEHDLAPMLSSVAAAEALGDAAQRAKRVVRVHCKVDTGMGREGMPLEGAARAIQQIARISHLDIEGIATHFPGAEAPGDSFTQIQVRLFRQLIKELERGGVPFDMVHAANSAGVVNHPESVFNAVRPGLMTYGVWPSQAPPIPGLLRPVLRWETRAVLVREFPEGAAIGYGGTYIAPGPMRAAVLPVGYADGYPVALSNRADVLIRGRRCPVRGRVSMDQIVVDVSHLERNVEPGETAVLIGPDGQDRISAEELAGRAGTIPYEILAGIGPRVQRVYL